MWYRAIQIKTSASEKGRARLPKGRRWRLLFKYRGENHSLRGPQKIIFRNDTMCKSVCNHTYEYNEHLGMWAGGEEGARRMRWRAAMKGVLLPRKQYNKKWSMSDINCLWRVFKMLQTRFLSLIDHPFCSSWPALLGSGSGCTDHGYRYEINNSIRHWHYLLYRVII